MDAQVKPAHDGRGREGRWPTLQPRQARATPSSPSSKRRTCIRCGTATSASRRSSRRRKDAPFIWRWRDIEPFLHRAVGEVSIDDIERRALIMAHPAFGGETTTTST